MKLITISELGEKTNIHNSMVRILVKRLKLQIHQNEKHLQCIAQDDEQKFLEYVKKDYKRKVKVYNCSPELLEQLEKDRAERKELFLKLYGKETEKWFNPNWWPSYEDITPSCFMEA